MTNIWNLKILSQLSLIVLCATLTSCFDDGGSSVSLGSDTSGAPLVTLSITKIQGLDTASLNQDANGKIYLKTALVNIEGICSRGVSNIMATINGVQVAETAMCKIDGTFSWDKTFVPAMTTLGSQYDIVLEAVNLGGSPISGASTTKTIIVDLVAPTAPVLSSVSGCTLTTGVWVCNTANVQVAGTWSLVEDVISLQSPSGGTSLQTSGAFTFDFSLAEGQSRTLDFTVTDRAGNISGQSSISISFSPTTSALASTVNTGGTVGFAGGPVGSAASVIANVGTMSGQSNDLNSGLPVDQKAQLIIGPMAVGAKQINP